MAETKTKSINDKVTNTDYELERQDKTPEEKEEQKETPKFTLKVKLSEKQQERLLKEIDNEFKSLKKEREASGLDSTWEEQQNVYDGKVQDNSLLRFNLHRPQAKIKVDAIVRSADAAFLEIDPMFSITPRPEFVGKNGEEVARKQEDFLDYAFDEEIQDQDQLTLTWRSGIIKYVGIIKVGYDFERENRKREETYSGEKITVGVDNVTGKRKVTNKGLLQFLDNYPDALIRYKPFVRKLIEGGTIDIVVNYKDTISNNPRLKNVKIENFYVRNSTAGNKGLRKTHLIVERDSYTWWELKDEEAEGNFENVDNLKTEGSLKENKSKDTAKQVEDFQNRDYDILECTYYFKLEEDDEEEIKLKVWISEESKTFLGAIYYPYYGFDTDYKSFVPKPNDKGFYGGGFSVITDLIDSNIAQDVLLNFMLQGAYNKNIITPIIKEGSSVEEQLLENKWTHGVPLIVDETVDDINKEISFVEWPSFNISDFITVIEYLSRQDGDVSGVSDLTTGQASTIDPSAPGNKTIALLQASGVNIKEYIRNLSYSFNELGTMILQLYYQMSNTDRKFRVRAKSNKVVGKVNDQNIFDTISRDEMIARTNIQSRAHAFAFDKIAEKQENLLAHQILGSSPYAQKIPKAMYESLRTVLKSWNPTWKNKIDQILPSPEEFSQQQATIAMGATIEYFKALKKSEDDTGVQQTGDLQQLAKFIQAAQIKPFNQENNG